MSTFFNNQKNLQRWFAAVTSDYESVISQFLTAEGDWTYKTFREKAKKCGTLYLHHCAVGKGKNMNEQHEFVTKVLIAMAKDLWLLSPMGHLIRIAATDEEPPEHEALSRVKQMVAGFYLTYAMYKSRIVVGSDDRTKIIMDSQDCYCLAYFQKCILDNGGKMSIFVKKQITYMLADLTVDEAFAFVTEATVRGINPLTRLYNNTIRSGASNINNDLKDQQYNYVLPTGISELSRNIAKFEAKRTAEFKKSLSSIYALRPSKDPLSTNELKAKLSLRDSKGRTKEYRPVIMYESIKNVVEPQLNTEPMNVDVDFGFTLVSVDSLNNDELSQSKEEESLNHDVKLTSNVPQQTVTLVSIDNSACSKELVPFVPIQSSQWATLDKLAQSSQLPKVMEASAICHLLNDRPVQTIPNVLANSIADRAMMFESRKRIERRALKVRKFGSSMIQEPHPSSTPKTSGSYIKDGGVFGRKKSRDDQLPTAARQPTESTSNLWNYINTGMFCNSTTVADNTGRDEVNK